MTVTINIILDSRRKKDNNTYPLKVRITIDRKYKDFPLSFFIENRFWDKKLQKVKSNYPDSDLVNNTISSKKLEYQKAILQLDLKNKPYDFVDILNMLSVRSDTNLIEYGWTQVDILKKTKKFGNAMVYEDALNKIKQFHKSGKIKFEQLTYQYLKSFEQSMLQDGIKLNSISVYMRTIRAIYNRAIKDEIVDRKYYPFNKYKIKSEKTKYRKLSIDNIKSISNLELPENTAIWHNRNYFLLSFCLIGMSFIDLSNIKVEDVFNGRLIYRRQKTGKVYSIKLYAKALEILNFYAVGKVSGDYILPIFPKGKEGTEELKKISMLKVRTCNKYLGVISKKLEILVVVTTYYSRYSWANIAKELGFSKDLIAEALGHDYGNRITGIYVDDFDSERIDEANFIIQQRIFLNH